MSKTHSADHAGYCAFSRRASRTKDDKEEILAAVARVPTSDVHAHEGGEAFLDVLNERLESGGGSALLLLTAIISFTLANMKSTSAPWLQYWNTEFGPAIGHHSLTRKDWVNEGLMAFFFFGVGLEIKKELLEGSLASVRKAAMPCVAAVGGMLVPMLIYTLVNHLCLGSMDGVVVPMATDIAFAMGVFCSVRDFLPPATAPFLLALATVDDLGAIAVIILKGGECLHPKYLVTAAAVLWASAEIGRRGIESSSLRFGVLGVALWYCLLSGGVNADVAGVLIAMCIPMRSKSGEDIVEHLISRFTPFSALVVLPVFALANCAMQTHPSGPGVENDCSAIIWAVPLGVMLGLFLGKPLGIFGFVYIPVKLGLLTLPDGLGNKDVLIVGMLGGIGFTMCLFLVEDSLEGPTARVTKMGVIVSSMLSAGVTSLSVMISGKVGLLQRAVAEP